MVSHLNNPSLRVNRAEMKMIDYTNRWYNQIEKLLAMFYGLVSKSLVLLLRFLGIA